MIFIVFAPSSPGITADDTVQLFDRTDYSSKKFSQKSTESSLAVIIYQIADAVRDLTDAHSSHGCCHQVTNSWRFYLTGCLPHHTSTDRIGDGLPEIHAVASRSIKVQ